MYKYIIIALILWRSAFAQNSYALAGINGLTYVDIVPDTLLNPMSTHNGGVDYNYYYIDINQDGTNDIKFTAHYGISPGSINQSVQITVLDTSTRFSFLKTDSSSFNATCGGPGYTNIGKVLWPYILNDTIKNGNYVNQGYLGVSVQTPGCAIYFNDTTWLQNHNQYIGVRYSTGTGYLYGWVRVLVSDYNTVLIKDFSLGAALNTISSNFNLHVNYIYPNPASTIVFVDVSTQNKLHVDVYDVNGKHLLNTGVNNKGQIDVSTLANGVYTLIISSPNFSENKKLVIIK